VPLAAGQAPRLFGLVWFLSLTAATYVLTQLFSDRGAFIHVGAIIGTCMVGNVFLIIIPNQRKIVADMLAGRPVDPRLGAMGKQRSVHNTHMTLPVIFIMISNHYPAGHGPSPGLAAAGPDQRRRRVDPLLLHPQAPRDHPPRLPVPGRDADLRASASSPASSPRPRSRSTSPVPFSTAQAIVQKHCVTCHSATPTHKGFTAPPNGAAFDTPEHMAVPMRRKSASAR
jgi:uncharacterized membrane protein